MNRRSPATALLAVVVLLAVALLATPAQSAIKKLPVTNPAAAPVVAVEDAVTPPGGNGGAPVPLPGPIEPVYPSLHDAMRHLWMDHVVWSRNVTMSVFSDLKGRGAYEDRLVKNAADMRDLISPYLGAEHAAYFENLYVLHMTLASQVFDAYKSGNETLVRSVTYDWYANADEIASFLCKINPRWDYAEMQALWRTHNDTVMDEMLDYKEANHEGDVMCYDAAQDHAFVLADYISGGIPTKGLPAK